MAENAGNAGNAQGNGQPQFQCKICEQVVFNRRLLVKKCYCCADNLVHKKCINQFLILSKLYTYPGCWDPIRTLSAKQLVIIALDKMQSLQLLLFAINPFLGRIPFGGILNTANFMLFAMKVFLQSSQLPRDAAWMQFYGFFHAAEIPFFMVNLQQERLAAITSDLFELETIKVALWIIHHLAVQASLEKLQRSMFIRNIGRSAITENMFQISLLKFYFLWTSSTIVSRFPNPQLMEKRLQERLSTISVAGPDTILWIKV